MGLDVNTERNRDRWRSSVVVRACREEGTKRKKARRKNKREQHPTAPKEGERHKVSGQRGNGTERKGQTRDRGWREKKIKAAKNSTSNDG